jgi:hypothetical protein
MQSHAAPTFSRRLKRSGGSLAAPALVPHPKAASRAARIGPMRRRERLAARRASTRRGESEARTAPSAAAMMLGRQIPIADETAQRRHAPEPARPVALCIGGHVRPADGGRGRRRPWCVGDDSTAGRTLLRPTARGNRHRPCRSEPPRSVLALQTVPRCPTEDTAKSTGLIPNAGWFRRQQAGRGP